VKSRTFPCFQNRRGAALAELAIVLPVLFILAAGTADFGRIFFRSMAVAQAARACAEFGAQSIANSADNAGMKSFARNAVAQDLSLVDADLTTSRVCECATDAGVFSPTVPSNTCDGTGCPSGQHTVITVNVTATKEFSTIVRYPVLPNTVTITRSAKIRVQ
jgi:Flp pilus assembly protein TadG